MDTIAFPKITKTCLRKQQLRAPFGVQIAMEDAQQQADEVTALVSIFGEECVREISVTEIKIGIPTLDAAPRLELRVSLPSAYPSHFPPVFELECTMLDASAIEEMARQMEAMFDPGEVVLYTWVAWLQQEWEQRAPPPPPAASSPSANQEDDAQELPLENLAISTKNTPLISQEAQLIQEMGAKIIHGEPLTEKRSTFQAHVAPVRDLPEISAVMDYLLLNNKIRAATHNIMAYRIEGSREGVFLQDSDDDGESAAGGRLLHLLQMVDARNVVVVVSRWFGGILLGPARFGLINKVARELLEAEGLIKGSGGGGGKKTGGK